MVDSYAAMYALVDPRTEAVRYIGRTVDLQSRYFGHIRNGVPSIMRWCVDLAKTGHIPVMHVLDIVEHSAWEETERNLIKSYSNLLNTNPGGEGAEPTSPRTYAEVLLSMGNVPWIHDVRPNKEPDAKLFDVVSSLNRLRSCKSLNPHARSINEMFADFSIEQQDDFVEMLTRIIDRANSPPEGGGALN